MAPLPHIQNTFPSAAAVGQNVQINGTNFISGGEFFQIFFNGVSASSVFTYNTTTIVCAVPVGATTGLLQLKNLSTGHQSNTVPFTVTASAVPHITSLTPNNGGIGISVVITGTNFGATQGSSTVTFNGTLATVATWSATSITVTVPAMATTGNVVVTTVGGVSNGVLFTVTNPSMGGTTLPIGMILIPVTQFTTPVVLTFDTTDFDDASSAGFYSYKVEEIIPGRTPSCTRQVIQYRDLGVATITGTLSGYDQNKQAPVAVSDVFTIGTVGATGTICTIIRGLSLTAQNLQYTINRAAGAGPVSIIKTHLEGAVETEPLA